MSTLGSIQTLVTIAIGGREDEVAQLVTKAAINFAISLVSMLFRPPEARMTSELSFSGGAESMSLNTLDWLDLKRVYNMTDSKELRFIPLEKLDSIIPVSLATVKYYSLFGNDLLLRASPLTSKVLKIHYLALPAELTEADEEIPYGGYDSYITTWAAGMVMAMFEETEAAGMWSKLNDMVGQPLLLSGRERDTIEGMMAYMEQILQGGK